jgi:hypothetical protein
MTAGWIYSINPASGITGIGRQAGDLRYKGPNDRAFAGAIGQHLDELDPSIHELLHPVVSGIGLVRKLDGNCLD